jgi:hypothetical protein
LALVAQLTQAGSPHLLGLIVRQQAVHLRLLAGRVAAVPVEQQLAATSISLAAGGVAAVASVELWQVLQETADLQYLAARDWG